MSFMYHMYGETVGSLTVYRFGNGLTKIQMWKTKGNQGDQWNHAAITFQCNVTSYQVRQTVLPHNDNLFGLCELYAIAFDPILIVIIILITIT